MDQKKDLVIILHFYYFHFFKKAFMKDICSLIRVRILISFVKARGRRAVLVLYSRSIKWSLNPSQLALAMWAELMHFTTFKGVFFFPPYCLYLLVLTQCRQRKDVNLHLSFHLSPDLTVFATACLRLACKQFPRNHRFTTNMRWESRQNLKTKKNKKKTQQLNYWLYLQTLER